MARGRVLDERGDEGDPRLTLALVCVPGGIYEENHVHRLTDQVRANLSIPYDVHVITDSDKPGWWAKIDLFRPGLYEGRVLYLDLDVTITGSLDDLVNIDAPFAASRDFQYPLQLNSSVMVWDAGVGDHIFTDFTPAVMDRLHGDQNWIFEKMPSFRRFPREWCYSYRVGLETGYPDDMRVCVYHGRPKPWEV